MTRIKTLAQIGEQCDRILDYLDGQGRVDTSVKVHQLYDSMLGRVLDTLGVDMLDDDALEMACEEPLIVGIDY